MIDRYRSFFNNPAFKSIHPRKQDMIIEMMNLMENQSSQQKLQILFSFHMKMKYEGLQLTKHETSLLLDQLKNNLTPSEKKKMDMMIDFMNMMQQNKVD